MDITDRLMSFTARILDWFMVSLAWALIVFVVFLIGFGLGSLVKTLFL